MGARSASKLADALRDAAESHRDIAALLNEAAERLAIAQCAEIFLANCHALERARQRKAANLPDTSRSTPDRSPGEAVAHQERARPYWLKDDE
ncbi:MAG TPA: hypothetical protein VGM17_02420 [Rhizomicrobium sp.]|jgi:copper homeostasis protein CutC